MAQNSLGILRATLMKIVKGGGKDELLFTEG